MIIVETNICLVVALAGIKICHILVYFVEHYLPRVVMRGLYYALIYPYLSYGNIVWGNT